MKSIAVTVIALFSLILTAAAVSEFPEPSVQYASLSKPDRVLRMAATELSQTASSAPGECSVICALPPVGADQ
jgi:hypothetical protein